MAKAKAAASSVTQLFPPRMPYEFQPDVFSVSNWKNFYLQGGVISPRLLGNYFRGIPHTDWRRVVRIANDAIPPTKEISQSNPDYALIETAIRQATGDKHASVPEEVYAPVRRLDPVEEGIASVIHNGVVRTAVGARKSVQTLVAMPEQHPDDPQYQAELAKKRVAIVCPGIGYGADNPLIVSTINMLRKRGVTVLIFNFAEYEKTLRGGKETVQVHPINPEEKGKYIASILSGLMKDRFIRFGYGTNQSSIPFDVDWSKAVAFTHSIGLTDMVHAERFLQIDHKMQFHPDIVAMGPLSAQLHNRLAKMMDWTGLRTIKDSDYIPDPAISSDGRQGRCIRILANLYQDPLFLIQHPRPGWPTTDVVSIPSRTAPYRLNPRYQYYAKGRMLLRSRVELQEEYVAVKKKVVWGPHSWTQRDQMLDAMVEAQRFLYEIGFFGSGKRTLKPAKAPNIDKMRKASEIRFSKNGKSVTIPHTALQPGLIDWVDLVNRHSAMSVALAAVNVELAGAAYGTSVWKHLDPVVGKVLVPLTLLLSAGEQIRENRKIPKEVGNISQVISRRLLNRTYAHLEQGRTREFRQHQSRIMRDFTHFRINYNGSITLLPPTPFVRFQEFLTRYAPIPLAAVGKIERPAKVTRNVSEARVKEAKSKRFDKKRNEMRKRNRNQMR